MPRNSSQVTYISICMYMCMAIISSYIYQSAAACRSTVEFIRIATCTYICYLFVSEDMPVIVRENGYSEVLAIEIHYNYVAT